jgi:hypothetical protein
MNKFTKEELMLLSYCVWHVSNQKPLNDSLKILLNKIKPMIDNYCEYEPKAEK